MKEKRREKKICKVYRNIFIERREKKKTTKFIYFSNFNLMYVCSFQINSLFRPSENDTH